MKKHIVCYGDSNTWGCIPRWKDSLLPSERYDEETRWPCVMASELGAGYHVIEEGLGGRTTIYDDTQELYKRGIDYLLPCLLTHRPLDLVIIMLGTNDMKHRFNLLPVDIANGAAELGKLVERYDYGPEYPVPKVLLVCPIELGEGIENSIFTGFSSDAVSVSRQLPPFYEKHAANHNWLYFNAASVAQPSKKDMLHMEKEDHLALAAALETVIRNHFGKEPNG